MAGAIPLPPGLDRFDDRADRMLDRLRGNPVADKVFYTASQFGDFSVVWHIVNVGLFACRLRTRRQLVGFAIALGAESLVVNQFIKRCFRRTRPRFDGDHPHHVRTPSTSSFPSGHASSATFAAMLLGADHPRLRWFFRAIALIVAGSRPYVRAHHVSDIAGGAATGAMLGRLARPVLRMATRR